MTHEEAIRLLMNQNNMSLNELALKCGYSGKNPSSSLLPRFSQDVRLSNLRTIANALGCEVALIPNFKDTFSRNDIMILDGNLEGLNVNNPRKGRPPKNSAQIKKAAEEPQPSKILLEIPQPEKLTSPPVAERLPNGNWLIHLSPASSNDQQVDNIVDRYSK